jgi:hypothetical protein
MGVYTQLRHFKLPEDCNATWNYKWHGKMFFCVKEYTCQCGKNILRIFFLAHAHDDKFMKY